MFSQQSCEMGALIILNHMFQSHSQQADEPEVKHKFRIKDFFLFILYPVNDLKYYFSNYCHFELNWIELNVCICFQFNDIPLWNLKARLLSFSFLLRFLFNILA